MARPKKLISGELVKKAENELEKLKSGKLAIRLKAIIAASKSPMANVTEVLQFDKTTIFRWINNFKNGGIERLKDKPKGHKASKLNENNLNEIRKWINESRTKNGTKILWTLKKLCYHINKEWNIQISTSSLWKHLNKMKIVLRRPRPIHHKGDKNKQNEFKKK